MGNELGSFKEDDRVQVVDDAAVLQHCIEECEDLEWDDEMYLDTVGRIGIVVRLDEDGLVVVQFEGCDEEKYYPNQALESAVVVVASEGKSTPQEGPVRSPVLSMAQASIRSLNQISFRSPKLKVIQSSFGNESEAYATSRLIRVVFTMAFSGFLIGYTLRSYAATSDTVCFGRNSRTLMTAVEGRVADHVCWTAASIGAILAGVCARCGRKGTAVVGSSLFIFGQVMSSGSRNASTFVLGHLFTGLGLGVLSTIAPLYICEVSPDQRRAMFVTFFVAMAAVGHLTASVLALFFSDEACDGRGWRWLLGVVVVPAIAHLLLLFRLPETPVFLARNGRAEEARRLALLLHPGCEPSADDLAQPAAGDHRPASLADFCSRYRLPAATGLALFALQQLLSPVAFEAECRVPGTASILLNQFGSSDEPATLLEKNQAYAGASCLVAVHALCMVFAIQMTTRRRLLLVSTGGCAVSLVCLGLLQAAGAGAPAQVAALAAHYVLHTTGLNCVPWVCACELYVAKYREMGMAACVCAMWATFNVVRAAKCASVGAFDGAKFFLASVISLLGFIYTYFKLPETSSVRLGRRSCHEGTEDDRSLFVSSGQLGDEFAETLAGGDGEDAFGTSTTPVHRARQGSMRKKRRAGDSPLVQPCASGSSTLSFELQAAACTRII